MWGEIWDGIQRSFKQGMDDPEVWLAVGLLFALLLLVGKIENNKNRHRTKSGA